MCNPYPLPDQGCMRAGDEQMVAVFWRSCAPGAVAVVDDVLVVEISLGVESVEDEQPPKDLDLVGHF